MSDADSVGLYELLDLELLDTDLFRGRRPANPRGRLFGGQVAAQALIAAQRSVDDDVRPHSLHAYFLRPGDASVPVVLKVDRLHDGRNFRRRRVTVVQHGEAILSMETSFTTDSAPTDFHVPAPEVPAPDTLTEFEWPRRAGHAPWLPFEIRPIPQPDIDPAGRLAVSGDVWFRLRGEPRDDKAVPATAVLTYASDISLVATVLRPTGRTDISGLTSLDHVMWFHNEIPLDGWLCYVKSSPAVGPRLGLAQGHIFTEAGTLVATVAQEGLVHAAK